MLTEKYNVRYAVANVRGYLKRQGKDAFPNPTLLTKELDALTEAEQQEILEFGEKNGIKLYHFKKSDRQLPRVHKVMGFLRGINFETLLDVGSGRGVFFLPFLEEFP